MGGAVETGGPSDVGYWHGQVESDERWARGHVSRWTDGWVGGDGLEM